MSEERIETLFEFVNSFPEVKELQLNSFSDLASGIAIAVIWNACFEKKISLEALGKPSNQNDWLVKYKNLRSIDNILSPVIMEKGWRGNDSVDIMGIAKGDITKLANYVQPLVMVSLSSPIKKDVVARIQSLSDKGRRGIKEIIQSYRSKPKAVDEMKTLQDEIEKRKKHISELETEISKLKSSKTHVEVCEIDETKEKFERIIKANAELRESLSSVEEEYTSVNMNHWQVKQRYESSKALYESSIQAQEDTSNLRESINQLRAALERMQETRDLDIKIAEMKRIKSTIDEELKVADSMEQSATDELKMMIDLSHKYEPVDPTIEPAKNRSDKSITELNSEIQEMMLHLVDIESGSSTKVHDVEHEIKERAKRLHELAAKKDMLEAKRQEGVRMREDLKRVQSDMTEQREKSRVDIEAITDKINRKNAVLADWLGYSSAFDSWRSSRTFLSELQRKYL